MADHVGGKDDANDGLADKAVLLVGQALAASSHGELGAHAMAWMQMQTKGIMTCAAEALASPCHQAPQHGIWACRTWHESSCAGPSAGLSVGWLQRSVYLQEVVGGLVQQAEA